VLVPSLLVAQSTGTISGFVTDPSGSAVPGAKITATLTGQNIQRTVESDADGSYVLNALPPGEYSLSAEKTGFERTLITQATLTVNQNLRADFKLQVGQISEAVTVTGQAPLVDTRSGTLSGLVDDRRVVDLPLNGRNVISLAVTLPGIVSVNAPQQLTDARSGPTMNVNGSLETQNMFTFNGGIFVNPSRQTGMNYPPPDAIQEFSIQTQDFAAEFGRNAGSQVNVVSKSGTNQFHGSAWEFLRNNDLNARNFFSATVPIKKQNQYGAAAGAPIKRDKLFVFGSFQRTDNHGGALSSQITVPTAQERAGDFTDLVGKTLKNPVDPITGQPFVDAGGAPCVENNIVRSTCITPMAKALLPLIPQSPSGKLTTFGPQPQTDHMGLIRTDWNQSTKNTVSAHVLVDNNLLQRLNLVSGSIPNYMSGFLSQQTTMATLNDTYSFRPDLVNQVTFTFLRTTSLSTTDKTIDPTTLGVNMPLYAEAGSLNINVGSLFSFGGGSGRVVFTNNNWQVRDVANWIKGRHNLKFGGEWLHLHFRQIFLGPPTFTFNATRTGNEFADFLTGAFYSVTGGFGVRTNDNFQEAPSLFVQDTFKISTRFTLTYGLRWEPFFPWVDRYDRLSSLAGMLTRAQSTRFPDAPPGILFAGDPGVPRGLSPDRWHYFAPRLGFAWDIFGDGKTSLRGAYGIFYDSIKADSVSEESAPWAGSYQAFNGQAQNPFGSVGQVIPPVNPSSFGCVKTGVFPGVNCPLYPLPLAGLYTGSTLVSPYIQAWNLTLQRQITPSIMVQAGYVGKAAIHVDGWQSINPARFMNDPITGAPASLQNVNDRVVNLPGILAPNTLLLGNSFRSWYNSFQPQITKRFGHGLSFNAAYTFGKSIDTLSTSILNYQMDNPFSLSYQRGRSDFDRRHVFVGSWLWAPQVRTGNKVADAVVDNWTFTGLHIFETGNPFTVREGIDVALDGTGSRQHAQLVPGATVTRSYADEGDMIAKYFNTAAFVPPSQVPPGTYGSSGRNILSVPSTSITNFSAIKDFKLKESYRLQFRSEFFNLFNHANFGCTATTGGCSDPDNNATSSTFGRIRTAGPSREIQFALKMIW
jgi:hypothetical protein